MIQNSDLQGIQLLGFTPGQTAALLLVDRAAVTRLAGASTPPFSSLFSAIAGILREPAPPTPPSGQATQGRAAKIPKKFKPYERYTKQQMQDAWTKSQMGAHLNALRGGTVSLYLRRAGLVEMYRQPAHIRLIYASLLYDVDSDGTDYNFGLQTWPAWEIPDDEASPQFKPYRELDEQDMLDALKALGIPPREIRPAYGRLGITLRRETLYTLYRRPRHVRPAVAYLLKVYDALHRGQSSGDPGSRCGATLGHLD